MEGAGDEARVAAKPSYGWFLIVDDEPLVRSVFGRILAIRPCRIAVSVEAAVEVAAGWDGCIGALIDENLGEGANPGNLLARIIRMNGLQIPVALVTGLARHGLHDLARELSISCYEKPLHEGHLRRWLCEALGMERGATREMVRCVRQVADEAALTLRQTDILMALSFEESRSDYLERVGLKPGTYRTHAARASARDGRTLAELAREVRSRQRDRG